MHRVICNDLGKLSPYERKSVLATNLAVFPSHQKMRFTPQQIKNLIEIYKARVFSIGDIGSSHFVNQIVVSSLKENNEGKIVLGNLKAGNNLGLTLEEMVNLLLTEQLHFFQKIYIEIGSKRPMFDILIDYGFSKVSDLDKTKEVLKSFIIGERNMVLESDGEGGYIRNGGYNGELKLHKNLLQFS